MAVPVTSISLLKVLGEDAKSPRWTEFATKYASTIEGFLFKYFPTVDAEEVVQETLITLVVSANRDIYAKRALDCINQLQRCDAHLSHIPTPGDEAGLRRLGISYTFDPVVATKHLFA